MQSFNNKSALIKHLDLVRDQKTTIGFVPTMGALHEGHLSLLSESLQNNDITIISIFVNPTQFNNSDDLTKYPRTLETDSKKIIKVSKTILLYAPSVDDIYEGKTVSNPYNFDGLENQMEGKFRPGHFNGVGTVVQKLFEIVKPTNAYFGKKDFQQLQIVKKLVEKQRLNVTIVGCEIFRETNGLAMSSRNERLSVNDRHEAQFIYKILQEAKILFATQSVTDVIAFVKLRFASQSLFELEYFEIADEATLMSSKNKLPSKKQRAFIAVFINSIRLIDTIALY